MQSNPSFGVARRLLYNHNPFYVISAGLVLCGVWRSVAGQESLAAGWPMLGLLCGYIALLAAAAWAIIRFGGVWQDARTLVVVIVLMLVALSMSFDAIAVLDSQAGRRLLIVGLAFALAASEVTMRALGIRLAWFYRGPYYAALALLFGYPIWLADLVRREDEVMRAWALMLFPTAAAAVLLLLLPAARLGRTRKWAAGTPWRWPLYPWTLFFFLALGLGARSYSLAFAFESELGGESGFRGFWLAPLVLACALLTLEMGRSAGSRTTQLVATIAPLGLIPLALLGAGHNATQAHFLSLLQTTLTSPIVLTAGMLIPYYAWAWLRKAPLAEAGLTAALVLAALVDSSTLDWRSLALHHPAPLGAILIVHVILSVRSGASWRMAVAAGMAIAAGCWPLREVAVVRTGYTPLHLMALSVLAIGLLFDDRLARVLRRAAPYLMPTLALAAMAVYPLVFPGTPPVMNVAYTVAVAGLAVLYWRREKTTAHLAGAMAAGSLLAATVLRSVYSQLDSTPLAAGRDWLAAGMACLGVGLLISLAKGGALRNAWDSLAEWNRRYQTQTPEPTLLTVNR